MRESPRRAQLDPLVAAFLADCRARRLSPRTLEHYTWSIRSYRVSLPTTLEAQVLADLDIDRARAWAESLSTVRSPASVGNAIAGLKVFSRWLVAEDHLRVDPIARLRKPRAQPPLILPLSGEQSLALLAAAPRPLRGLLALLLDTGLRIGEAVALEVDDVRLGFVRVRHAKGGRERLVPYGREMDATLRRYLTRDRPRAAPGWESTLFLTRSGRPWTPASVRRAMKRLGEQLGIDDVRVSPHTLRHTFARDYLVNGAGELALQQALGHRDLAMVRRYVTLAESDLRAIHARSSPLDRLRADRRGPRA